MKGLVFDTENRIQFKDFSEPLLDSLQKEVSGYIEGGSSQVSAGRAVHGGR